MCSRMSEIFSCCNWDTRVTVHPRCNEAISGLHSMGCPFPSFPERQNVDSMDTAGEEFRNGNCFSLSILAIAVGTFFYGCWCGVKTCFYTLRALITGRGAPASFVSGFTNMAHQVIDALQEFFGNPQENFHTTQQSQND